MYDYQQNTLVRFDVQQHTIVVPWGKELELLIMNISFTTNSGAIYKQHILKYY